MDRNREARRASSIVGSKGFNRRRHRTNSLRDSPDEDGGLEFPESVRLRDRLRKDRDRERDRDIEREREKEKERGRERERDLRERSTRRKRRRGERLSSNREDIGDETSEEESLNDDEDDDDEENTTAGNGAVRLLMQEVDSVPNHPHHHGLINDHHHHSHSSSFSQQHHNSNSTSNTVSSNHHLQHRKSFPPNPSSAKISRAPPVWKSAEEMISVTIPRKARSLSTKRSHDWMSISSNNSGGGVSGVEQNLVHPSSSPTSPNASIRKKLKPTAKDSGQKLKPPKAATKVSSNSSNPEELEIEIAEVLYGLLTQSQAPSSRKDDSRENNRLSSDAKSQNSSPMSNSSSANNLISGSNSVPLSAVAPKRKRPRQIPDNLSYGVRNSHIPAKPDAGQTQKTEKISVSEAEYVYEMAVDSQPLVKVPPSPALTPPESAKMGSELKPEAEDLKESRDSVAKEVNLPKEKVALRTEDAHKGVSPPAVIASWAAITTKANSMGAAMENRKEEKFEIDLMAPPPLVRPSSYREIKNVSKNSPMDKKQVVSIRDADFQAAVKDEADENGKSERDYSSAEDKKVKVTVVEAESNKAIENKERNLDLHLDFEKSERDGGDGVNAAGNGNKSQSATQKQKQTLAEKSGHSTSSLPLPMMASWPGVLPPMGYMAPLQGVVSMEAGNGVAAPAHIPPLFNQPRQKRCATHCHIARNIYYLQQLMKMNPFWPAPAASASLFGPKPCNLNVVPGPDMLAVRGANAAQDKGRSVANIPNHVTKEKGSQPASASDSARRKQQFLIQQALPPVAPSNLLGPAFIFPLNQQQSSAPRPSGAKSPAAAGVPSSTCGSAVTTSSSAAAVSFNYPNMASSETQYLAIVQNNGYSFPLPAAAVVPPSYRGNPAQAMPLFNGPFYSSQMIHPSHLQQLQPPSIQSQLLEAHQNASASTGSSASQKHLQSQQQRIQSVGVSSGSGTASLQNLSSQKTQLFQRSHNQYVHPSRPRNHEGEPGHEDSPTTDSRGSRTSMNIYGHNFAMSINPPNFGLMNHSAALAGAGAATSGSSNLADKKGHQAQQQGSKTGPDSLPAHSFAMSFGTMNGAAAQSDAMFQNSSEVTRQNIQMMAAQKNFRVSDDGNSGGVDSSTTEDEMKSLTGKASGGGGQSIAFTRSSLTDGPVESSTRSRNAASGAPRDSRSMATSNIQAQLQQQHMHQLKQQQMAANSVGRSEVAVTSNGYMCSEHLNSSSTMDSKFPIALSGVPPNLVQSSSSNSPSQSPQWKASGRTSTPQTPSSLASSTPATLKNLPQQRTQAPMHTQISFGGNQKPSAAPQAQAHPISNQNPCSQMMMGSPTTSSVSKGASGSPRTTSSASTNNKTGQASSLSAQPAKNSPSVINQKSPSILGNPHVAAAASTGGVQKPQMQQMPKAMQQQLFFSNPYAQFQPPHSSGKSSTTSGASGYYVARRQTDQHQQSPGAPVTSGGVLSLCPPVTLGVTTTNDPATAIATAAKAGGLPSHGIVHASQFAMQTVLPAGFSYVHPVPAAVPVKPAEQKQPAGNDNLHPWQPEKK